jgi:hypothetical protein
VSDDIDTLRQRLADARAKRTAEADARALAREPDRLLAEIACEERRAVSDAAYADLQAEHGESAVRRVDTDDGDAIVVVRPAMVAFKRFQQSPARVDDCDAFVRTCVVYPSKERYNAIVSKYPAIVVMAANAASELAGVRKREQESK